MKTINDTKKGIQKKYLEKTADYFASEQILLRFAPLKTTGTIAQLVEHRTENPGVLGSIPSGTTRAKAAC